MPLLEIQDVHHTYAGAESSVQALRGVSLAVEPGSFTALMGPSGCGKSTLLHLCGAMERPTRGEIRFEATALSTMTDEALTRLRRDRIGFVFQSFNLLPTLTVLENIALPLRLAGATRSSAAGPATALAERVGLSHRLAHVPAQLSGGEKQRAAIARALVHSPKLVIADEPTGSLDSANGEKVVALLRELNQETGVTLLLATHDQAVAATADCTLRLKDGQLVNDP